jgi:hypothetical protein
MRPFSSVPVGKRNPETQTILSSQAGGAERSKRTAFFPAGEEAWLAEEVAVLEAAKEGGERHEQSDLCRRGIQRRGADSNRCFSPDRERKSSRPAVSTSATRRTAGERQARPRIDPDSQTA